MIPFNKPYCSGRELDYIKEVCGSMTMSGNGDFTKRCHAFFEQRYGFRKCLLCTSGTDALEMCAMLCELQPGDEVIVPSYTFVSSAIAFLREGARVVFADSGKENPNMTVETIAPLITERTKVIVVVHYAHSLRHGRHHGSGGAPRAASGGGCCALDRLFLPRQAAGGHRASGGLSLSTRRRTSTAAKAVCWW